MKQFRTLALATAALASMFVASTARADYVVSFSGPATIAAGSSGIFDVLISGTPALSGFNIDVLLSGTGVDASFDATQPSGYVLSSPYVLSPPSATSDTGSPVFSTSATEILAQDVTSNGVSATLDANHNLLAVLMVDVSPTAAPGSTFTLSLNSVAGSNFFTDPAGANVPFTSTPGSFTVKSVPEPASLTLLGLGSLALMGIRRMRRAPRVVA
jgi:hypothetical protein